MKLHRSALMAGLLALGVAACGDDVEVVSPTPPVAPLPPPVEATMAPASATVAVGNSVVFAVNASGGVSGEAASWTCASSNTGIATVSSTSAGCSATGIVAGAVTITASVSKSGETVNVGAELTVTSDAPPPADAIVIVYSVLNPEGDPFVPPISGRVNVVVNLDRGTSDLYGLDLLVDGESVAHQSFTSTGMGMAAPADDEAAEQAALQTVLSFDTHDYDVADGVGVPKFENGDHVISARLTLAGADMMAGESVTSNEITIGFRNAPRFVWQVATDGNRGMDSDGLMWNSGAVGASVVPVIYTGETVSQIEFGLRHATVAGGTITSSRGGTNTVGNITDDEAPFQVGWENANASGSNPRRVGGIEPGEIVVQVITSALADGSAGPTFSGRTVDSSYFLRLDNKGPAVSNFQRALQFNRNYPISNWVGADHAFTFSSSSTTPDFNDGGVGRNREDHEYRAGTSTDDVSVVTAPSDLSETFDNSRYVLSATTSDLLGNEATYWSAGFDADDAACAAGDDDPAPEEFVVPDHCTGISDNVNNREAVDANANYKFGVDLTAPTQRLAGEDYLVDGGVIRNQVSTENTEGRIRISDPVGGSGSAPSSFPASAVHTRITHESPAVRIALDACVVGSWSSSSRSCRILGAASASVGVGTDGRHNFLDRVGSPGYYFIEYAAMDNAGNTAEFTTLRGVLDVLPPAAVVSFAPPVTAGEAKVFSVTAFDDLDLDRADGFLVFDDANIALQHASQVIGGFGAPYETNVTAQSQIRVTGSLQVGNTAANPATAYAARVFDQAGNKSPDVTSALGAVAAADGAPGFGAYAGEAPALQVTPRGGTPGTTATLCWDVDGDGCPTNEATASLVFAIEGNAAVAEGPGLDGDIATTEDNVPAVPAAPDPFARGSVMFYVSADGDNIGTNDVPWRILPGRGSLLSEVGTGGETDYTWDLDIDASDVAAAAGHTEIPDPATVTIRAVGFNDQGEALTHDAVVTITLNDN